LRVKPFPASLKSSSHGVLSGKAAEIRPIDLIWIMPAQGRQAA
jgi:hypothetical protein